MTPLEASKHFRNQLQGVNVYADEYLDIIEQALKEYEMEHTLRIRLENINYELCREKERSEKKLKALEIIKELPNEDKQVLLNAIYTYTKSEEKYDLLKEILGKD